MAKLVFLGRLEDVAGGAEREVPGGPLAGVLVTLESDLAAALSADRIRLALNGTLVSDRNAIVLGDGDELAFLPPVSGG
ncbi:MoaD/ThiS family protein [Novosphingobium sp. JCM 18896]|uniref:MoaD/ThiS family protein n=1 Tax=Novosphingobium sp. JCM 18896 TaxID=2989731 RepID=UPI00222217D3|nr:MoaD/ThiS family protein [Novosphingobium sp. JCM 18896]MCW1430434.1 MoaD/ThiS family protein [Novosphingobium sp. JCM 18896]